MITRDALSKTVVALYETDAYQATKFLSPKEIVRATRIRYKRKGWARSNTTTVVVTTGRPNWDERRFIKKELKKGTKFPIKALQLKFGKRRS